MMKLRSLGLCLLASFLLLHASGFADDDELAEGFEQWKSAARHFALGLDQFRNGDLDKASEAFTKCVRKMPRHAYAHFYIANLRYMDQDYPLALAHMEQAVEGFEFMQKLTAYADERKTQDMEALRRVMEEIGEASFSCRESRKLEFIDSQLDRRESDQEMAARRRATQRNRLEAQYHHFYGNVLFQLKRVPEALQQYQAALELDPGHAGSYNNIIAILYLAEQAPLAWDFLKRAEAQGIDESLDLKLIEMVYTAMDEPTEGILREDLSSSEEGGPGVMRFALAVRSQESRLPPLYVNAYVAFDPRSKHAVLIDPGVQDQRIEDFVGTENLEIKAVLLTHGHSDHTGAGRYYAELFDVPVCAHAGIEAGEDFRIDRHIEDGDRLEDAGLDIQVLHTPGHSPGSVCFRIGDVLFSGDTLFKRDIGKVWASDDMSEKEARNLLLRNIRQKLWMLPDATRVCPGHGRATTIADEKTGNPFFK